MAASHRPPAAAPGPFDPAGAIASPGPATGTGSTVGLSVTVTGTSPAVGPAAPPPPGYGDRGRPARGRRDVLTLVGCAVLGTVLGVAGARLTASAPTAKPSASPQPSATPTVIAKVSSYDPSGGSGFRKEGSAWKSQTYASAKFGNLKPGIGLVLDLGSDTTLSAVTFTAQTSPLTVQLYAGDAAPSGPLGGFTAVGGPVTATGATTLPAAAGGKHRYWLVFVTGLAAADGGFTARLSEPVAKG